MTENEAIEYMENEVRCIKQASHCDRDCLKCGLVKEEQPLLESFAVAIQALEEIQAYRVLEQRLKNVYGECDRLLETVVSSLERHENLELPNIVVKSRLLTDEDVDNWDAYRAIGTVDEVAEMSNSYINYFHKVRQYEAIGTIEEFKGLKESKCKYWNAEHEDCALSYEDIRAKAIDDFAEQLCIACGENTCKVTINGMKNVDILTLDSAMEVIMDVAERMKGGVEC